MTRRSRDWNLPEAEVTPEPVFLSRREILRRTGWAAGVALAGSALPGCGILGGADDEPYVSPKAPARDLYPVARNPDFADAGRELTDASVAGNYNNFYEFSLEKSEVAKLARDYPFDPWQVEVTGLVSNPRTFDIDDLIRAMPLDERIYRFRCVEAWSMTVPWTGFPLKALLEAVGVKPEARHVRLVSFDDPERLPGQTSLGYPWPYFEGLTLEEATNDLTLLATGIYGHPLPPQHGAPIRLVTPWKYGFKSIKSVVRIELVADRPKTFWSEASTEYGFFANIDPSVPHRRWSQATERLLGSGDRVPTQLYNGYGRWVADLYEEIKERENVYY